MAEHKAKFTISDSIILLRLHENALKKTEALKKCDAFLNTGYRKDQDKCFASKNHLYQVAAVFYSRSSFSFSKPKSPLIEMFSDADKDTTKKNALEAIKTYLTVFATEKAANSVKESDLVFFINKTKTLEDFSKKNEQETELEDDELESLKKKSQNVQGGMSSTALELDNLKEDTLDQEMVFDEIEEQFKGTCIGWKVGFSIGLK